MSSNDEKTVIGESAFNMNENKQSNTSSNDNAKPNSSTNSEPKSEESNILKDNENTDKKKDISKGKVIAGVTAAAGVAGIAGVAAGTAYSEEIKTAANDLLGKEDTEKVEDEVKIAENEDSNVNSVIEESAPIENVHSTDLPPDYIPESTPIDVDAPDHITLSMNGENGEAIAMNLVDDNMDGVADHVQLIENEQIVGDFTPEEFNSYLSGDSIEEPNFNEGITYGEPDVIFDENLSSEGDYDIIDYAALEDSAMEELSVDGAGDYLASEDSFDGQESVYVEDSEISGSDDYLVEEDYSGDDYLAQNDDFSSDEFVSEDYSSNDYESQLDSTDFDSMDGFDDFSSSDTDFSSDLI